MLVRYWHFSDSAAWIAAFDRPVHFSKRHARDTGALYDVRGDSRCLWLSLIGNKLNIAKLSTSNFVVTPERVREIRDTSNEWMMTSHRAFSPKELPTPNIVILSVWNCIVRMKTFVTYQPGKIAGNMSNQELNWPGSSHLNTGILEEQHKLQWIDICWIASMVIHKAAPLLKKPFHGAVLPASVDELNLQRNAMAIGSMVSQAAP